VGDEIRTDAEPWISQGKLQEEEMTEQDLLNEVITLLDARPELLWAHFPDSRKQQGITGFPDMVITGPYGVMFRELKLNHKAKLEGNQVRWKYALTAARANYAVWTEWDLLSGGIALALDRIAYGSQIAA
jgi:hypothetical protein